MEDYSKQIEKLGNDRMKAARKLELTTAQLREFVKTAVDAGMSQSEAARLAGVRRQTVQEWCAK